MAEWWSIEVFHSGKLPATRWKDAYEDQLTEAAVTNGAVYWEWHEFQYGVIFEVCFRDDEEWEAFRARVPGQGRRGGCRQTAKAQASAGRRSAGACGTDPGKVPRLALIGRLRVNHASGRCRMEA